MKTLQFELIPANTHHVVMDTTTGRVISESLHKKHAEQLQEELNAAVVLGPKALARALGATE